MEQRLIDANILLDRLAKVEAVGIPMSLLIKLVEGEQTVDAVEVIRCKDCAHHYYDEEEFLQCECGYGLTNPSNLDFCSYGEWRKPNGNL